MASATTDRRQGLTGDKGFKAPIQAATTANIVLSGEQTIDGVAMHANGINGYPDRVLVWNQTNQTQNGIWDVSTGSWTRSQDANGTQDLVTGTMGLVTGGATHANQQWILTTTGIISPGSTALVFQVGIPSLPILAASSGSSLIGFIQDFTGAVARLVQDKLRESKSLQDFGGVADWNGVTGTDNADAIEEAIKFSATSKRPIDILDGRYYTTKPLNFNSVAGDIRHGANFIAKGKAEVFTATGAIFYVDSGKACAEIIDSYHCNLIGLGFVGLGTTSLGIVAARGTYNGGPGHHLIRDCMVYVKSSATTNSNVGSIGLLNVACEETIVDNCDLWAAIPYVGSHRNVVNLQNLDGSSLPLTTYTSYSYVSYYATPLVSVSSSNTVFRVTGQGRFIALNSQGPNVLLETASDVDLGHTFMQRVLDAADGTAVNGSYPYALQLLSVFGLRGSGTVEHCESLALISGELDNATIDYTLGSADATLAELVFCEPAAGGRLLKNNRFTIRGIYPKAPAKCIRNTSGDNLFQLDGTTIKTTSPQTTGNADSGFWSMLNIAKNTTVEFNDQAIFCNKGIYQFQKVIAHATSNVLLDIYMPDTGATGTFYTTALAECITENVLSTQASGSIYASTASWVGANSTTGFGPSFAVASTARQSVNFDGAISNLTALVPTEVTTGASGKMSLVLTPTIAGSSVQPQMTKAIATITVARRDGWTILII